MTKMLMAAGLVLTLGIVGCGGQQASQPKVGEKVTITFWDENAGPDRTPYYEELIKRFEQANPTIHVEYVGLPRSNSRQKIDAAIAGNDLPDVSGCQASWVSDFAGRGALMPLDSFFEKWSEKDKFSNVVIDSSRKLTLDHKLYEMPNTMNLDCLWYRADWFKEAGITPPETFEQFFDAIEKMTTQDKSRYGFSIRAGNGGSYQLERMIMSNNGDPTYIDANGKCLINSPKNVEFVKKYLEIYQKNTPKSDVTNDYKAMVAGFDSGAVAMIQHNIGSYGEHNKALKPDQYRALSLPKASNGKYLQASGNVNGYVMFKASKHQEEAWKFISFLCSAPSQSYWNKAIGQMPTHNDVYNEAWAKELPHMQMAVALLKDPNLIFFERPVYLPEYVAIMDQQVDPGMQAVMTGKKTVEEFLNEWASALERSKQKYDQYLAGKKQ